MEEIPILIEVLENSRYAVFATVNSDGSPHNSPLFFIPSSSLRKIYMGTHPESLHAKNIRRTGEAFAVVFGPTSVGGRGLYLTIQNFHEATNDIELSEALSVHNKRRVKFDKDPLPIRYYQAPNPQRMYVGDIIEITANGVERDDEGRIIQDVRYPVDSERLISRD
jgi:hypothetical protein